MKTKGCKRTLTKLNFSKSRETAKNSNNELPVLQFHPARPQIPTNGTSLVDFPA